jgi:SulP family sulfate permease
MSSSLTGSLPVCPIWLYRLFPFLKWWPMVNRASLRDDAIAGLTGAIIVLPQGVAFATIAGLPPEYGLYAAMVPAIMGALFGSSRHLVSGPTTAISIVVFSALSPLAEPGSAEYIRLALTLALFTGIFQLSMGLARMGALVNFISHSVVIGFTAGAAVLIAASQLKNFSGIDIPRGAHFHEIITHFLRHITEINPYVMGVGVFTLLVGILVKRFFPRFPYMIAAMLAGSFLALALDRLSGVETGIRTVGALPSHLPPLSLPDLSLNAIKHTFSSALAITMLALTEAVSISRAIAVKSGQRIEGNQEFIGQGLSNLVGSFFSSYPSSGSFNRSGLNYAAGAKTPLASVFAAICLALILLLVAPLAAYLPIPAMAGILFLVAWGLIDFHHIGSILHASRQESLILGVTFFATLFVELEFAIYVGIILSLMLYLNRTSRPEVESLVPDSLSAGRKVVPLAPGMVECPQLKMLRVHGSLFFGAVDHVQGQLLAVDEAVPTQKHLILMMKGVNFIDVAGAEMLAQEARRRRVLGGGLYLYGAKPAVLELLAKTGYFRKVGKSGLFDSKSVALKTLVPRLDNEFCRNCTTRIFHECQFKAGCQTNAATVPAPARLSMAISQP